jgi:hypothetical protein
LTAPIQKDHLAAMDTTWRNCAADSEKVVESEYLQQHANFMRNLVCNATTDRKEIAAGITNNLIFDQRAIAAGITKNWISDDQDRRDYSSRLAGGLLGLAGRDYSSRLAQGLLGLDGKECASTKELSEQTKARLSEFASAPLPGK